MALVRLLWLLLILYCDSNEVSNSFEINIEPGQCVAILFRDGYLNNCRSHLEKYNGIIRLNDISSTDRCSVILYNKETGYINDFVIYDNENSTEIASSNTNKIGILYPSHNDVISTNYVDIHYYFLPNASTNNQIHRLCIMLIKTNTNNSNDTNMICKCALNNNIQILRFNNLTTSSYIANFYITYPDNLIHNITEYENIVLNYMSQIYFTQKSTLPPPFKTVSFHVKLPVEDLSTTTNSTSVPMSFPCIYISRSIRQLLITINRINSVHNASHSEWQWLYTSPNTNTTTTTDKNSTYNTTISNNNSSNSNILPIIHTLILSSRSYARYKEANIMLKSLVSSHISHSNILVIHIVTDRNGYNYFQNLWLYEQLYNISQYIILIFHDIYTVCEVPLHTFLYNVDMTQSYHHSGVAGYCRLFLQPYFDSLLAIPVPVSEVPVSEVPVDDVYDDDVHPYYSAEGEDAGTGTGSSEGHSGSRERCSGSGKSKSCADTCTSDNNNETYDGAGGGSSGSDVYDKWVTYATSIPVYDSDILTNLYDISLLLTSSSSRDFYYTTINNTASVNNNTSYNNSSHGSTSGNMYTMIAFTRSLLNPHTLITLETDQLILTYIYELYTHFSLFNSTHMIGAAENYQV